MTDKKTEAAAGPGWDDICTAFEKQIIMAIAADKLKRAILYRLVLDELENGVIDNDPSDNGFLKRMIFMMNAAEE